MRFLFDDATRRRRIWRVDDLLLMVLRTLAVLLLVVAMTRPLVSSRWLPGVGGRDIVMIVDVSLSIARVENGRPVFDEVIAHCGRLIDGLADSDQIRIMAAGD